MKRDWLFTLGFLFLAFLLLVAVFGPLRYDVTRAVGAKFLPPSGEHWFGTDHLGRDIFCRLAFGARMSLMIGVAVQIVAVFFGMLIGTGAGYGPRWIGNLLMRFTDSMFAFPDILLAILMMGVLRSAQVTWFDSLPKVVAAALPVFAALAVVGWPGVARIVRNQVLSLKEQEFIIASRALGAPHRHVVMKHILPHLWGIIMAVTMVNMAMVILAEGSLSFLGIGIPPPWPSWGSMINDARPYMASTPMLLAYPCIALSLTVLALNFVGDGLRDRFDPKLNTRKAA